jgi:hypothetical protein
LKVIEPEIRLTDMKTKSLASGSPRINRPRHNHIHVLNDSGRKLRSTAICPVCHAVYRRGRWEWREHWPLDAHSELCEACRRTRAHYPAGEVTLKGRAIKEHKFEILNLARHLEQIENAEHPLHRIMTITEGRDVVIIHTTDRHLARHIGEAVRRAHKGKLDWHYDNQGCFVRVNWTSEPEDRKPADRVKHQ